MKSKGAASLVGNKSILVKEKGGDMKIFAIKVRLQLVPLLGMILGCSPAFYSSCASPQKEEAEFVDFISRYEEVYLPQSLEIQDAYWRYAEVGTDSNLIKVGSLLKARHRVLHDQDAFRYLSRLREKGTISDPYLQRQLEVLYRMYLPCQAPLGIQDSILSIELDLKHRMMTRLSDSGMREADFVLRNSKKEADLEKAWLYVKSSGNELGQKVRQLVRLRNRLAQSVGFDDYFALSLFLEEQEESYIDSLFHELEGSTEEAYMAMRMRLDSVLFPDRGNSQLRPWHLRGKFFRLGQRAYGTARDGFYEYVSMENVVVRFFSSISLDLSDVFARSRISAQSVYLPWLSCINMDCGQDVRIIGRISGTESDMQMMLAMAAEAAYYKHISHSLPSLLRCPSSPLIFCGIAAFFARMAAYPNWVLSMGVFSAGQTFGLKGSTLRAMRQDQLFTCRWWLMMYDFEKRMYENPDQDLDVLWASLFSKYMRIDLGSERLGLSDWAAENYFSMYAVQAHNFVMGELWASQLLEHLCQIDSRMGKESNPNIVGDGDAGQYIKRYVFHPGASQSWQDLTVSATGSPLSNQAFLRQFAR